VSGSSKKVIVAVFGSAGGSSAAGSSAAGGAQPANTRENTTNMAISVRNHLFFIFILLSFEQDR
jgi:hypothetical protein